MADQACLDHITLDFKEDRKVAHSKEFEEPFPSEPSFEESLRKLEQSLAAISSQEREILVGILELLVKEGSLNNLEKDNLKRLIEVLSRQR